MIKITGLLSHGVVKQMSADGRLLLQHTVLATTLVLNISRYAKGTYLVQYTAGNKVVNSKIIKQ
jgi:hypothetical protein